MKVLIIDNDQKIREALRTMLITFCPGVGMIQEADGVATGLSKHASFNPDLIFLDVEMDDGTGFDFIKKVGRYNFQLVFITAHDKYAVDAFRMSAIDFLQKPVDLQELVQAVDKAKKGIQNSTLQAQVEILTQSIASKSNADKRIVLKDHEAIHFVKIQDIVRCEADGAYTKFVIANSSPILLSKSLKEYEDLLVDDGFIRCHHSHLVNTTKILRFEKGDGGTLVMENKDIVPVSQRKKEQVLEILSRS